MSLTREETTLEAGTELSDTSHSDYPLRISRQGSLASSRFSSRLSRCSGTRDVAQSLDEFVRKQRVVRYMQEERERSLRSKLLREEHDAWVDFRNQERVERLKYMTEQEVAELLRREAEEATSESNGADQLHKRVTQDALRRRQNMVDVGLKDENEVPVPRKKEVPVDEIRRTDQRKASGKSGVTSVAERERNLIMQLRQREENLERKCKRLTSELEESRAAAALAQRSQKRAEDDLARQLEKMEEKKSASAVGKEISENLVIELADVRSELVAMKSDKKGLEDAKMQALRDLAQAEEELRGLKRHHNELVAQYSTQKSAAEDDKKSLVSCQGELKGCRDALLREQTARGNAESQLEALREETKVLKAKEAATRSPDPQQEENYMRKLRAVADDARRALADLVKERQARETAEVALTEAAAALAKEQTARAKAEKELQMALAAPAITLTQPQRAESNLKRLVDAERRVEEMRKARNMDEVEKAALRREVQRIEKALESEAAARAQFEQLASKAVSAEDRVPQEEVVRLRRDLQASQKKFDAARRETVACRQNAEREISSLKTWCEHLQKQMLHQGEDEFTPRTATPTPHSRTPRTGRNVVPKNLAVSQLQADEKAARDHRIGELEAQVTRLREELERRRDAEMRLLREVDQMRKAASAPTGEWNVLSNKTHANGAPRTTLKEQGSKERALLERLESLESAYAKLQSKYDALEASHTQAESARVDAERRVEAQRAVIEKLRTRESPVYAPALENSSTMLSEPIAASNGEKYTWDERFKEEELILERSPGEAAERPAGAPRKDGGVIETEVRCLAMPTGVSAVASGGGAKPKPQKVSRVCC